VRGDVLVLPALEELEELLRAALLEQTHERALDRLHLRAGNLRDLPIAVHERACDLLELEVARDVGVYEDLRELAGRNDELGYEVDRIVAVAAQARGRLGARAEVAVELFAMIARQDTRLKVRWRTSAPG
jgi:hypothetical protein